MTLNTFIERLKHWTGAAGVRWHLDNIGGLRTQFDQCPITCVTQHEKDTLYDATAYDDAAHALGMHIHLADKIVYAADSDQGKCDQKLRAQLLAACGVTERR